MITANDIVDLRDSLGYNKPTNIRLWNKAFACYIENGMDKIEGGWVCYDEKEFPSSCPDCKMKVYKFLLSQPLAL